VRVRVPVLTSHRNIALLLAVTLVAYANAFYGTFQFDDFASILNDPRLASASAFLMQLPHMIRPVLKLTFLIDRRLYGENPAGYHLLNVLLHCANGLLVYGILYHAASCVPVPNAKFVRRLPLWTALLFSLHPVETETVTYLSGRATGLMACCCLLSLYLFLCATEPGTPRRKFLWGYGGALLCFVLALLSKEAAVTLPCILLLWHVVFRQGAPDHRSYSWRPHLPFWAVLLLGLGFGWSHPRYVYLAHLSLEIRPIYENLLTQANAVAYALSLFFLPARLNFDHDLAVFHSFFQWPTPLSLLLLGGMMAAALWSLRRAPFFSFGILWFFIQILPTNSVVPRYDILSERNLYLPSLGIFLSFVALSLHLAPKLVNSSPTLAPAAIKAASLLVVAGLLVSTVSRNRIYRDQLSFWSDAVRKSPQKARTHNNLGYAYFVAGDLDSAMEEFRTALSLDRGLASAQHNLLEVWKLKQSRLGRSLP
jgi:tetratricopeptide (TPR) repeat protein